MGAESLEITIPRHFSAPRETVFAEWLEAESLKDWFTPQTYTGILAKADARVGGRWQVEYQSPDGGRITEHGIYKAIEPFERLVLTLNQSVDPDSPETTIFVTLEEGAEGARLCTFGKRALRTPRIATELLKAGWVASRNWHCASRANFGVRYERRGICNASQAALYRLAGGV